MSALYVVVAYDIEDDRRRARIARTLEGYGERVQYSVFECEIEERHLQRLVRTLQRMMEPGDAVRIYRMPRSRCEVLILGGRQMVESPRVIIV
jgi:CRISPR-associated protein Cas2